MKRWIALCLLLCGLCGCAGKTTQEQAAYTTDLLTQISQAQAFSEELEELDRETAFMVYRFGEYELALESVQDCGVLRSSGATCEEGAVLVWESEEQAEQAQAALQDYVETQIEVNVDYRPDEIPKLENALVQRQGNSVILIVADNMDAVSEILSEMK